MPEIEGWRSCWFDDPSDDALTVAVLTDADVPSLLNTDVKV